MKRVAGFVEMDHGFKWGAARVIRLASAKGYVVLGVRTDKTEMEIQVSPSGNSIHVRGITFNSGRWRKTYWLPVMK